MTAADFLQNHQQMLTENQHNADNLDPTDPSEAATAAGLRPGSNEWLRDVKRRREEQDREKKWEEVAVRQRAIWDEVGSGSVDLGHPYLQRKGITTAHGIRQTGDRLLVPMRGLEAGAPLMSLQSISPNGRKLYAKGGRTKRTRATIGARAFKKTGTLYVCEGWATGWTINHVTGDAVVVAFSAGNLKDVAVAMREKYPNARIVICADNDWKTNG